MDKTRIFRDIKQIFLPNKNFIDINYGFLLCQLINDKMNVNIVLFQKDDNIEDIKQIYKKYKQFIPQYTGIQLVEYFQIDENNGENADAHIDFVEQELKELKKIEIQQ